MEAGDESEKNPRYDSYRPRCLTGDAFFLSDSNFYRSGYQRSFEFQQRPGFGFGADCEKTRQRSPGGCHADDETEKGETGVRAGRQKTFSRGSSSSSNSSSDESFSASNGIHSSELKSTREGHISFGHTHYSTSLYKTFSSTMLKIAHAEFVIVDNLITYHRI